MNRYESMIDLWIWILTWKIWLGYDHDRSMFDVHVRSIQSNVVHGVKLIALYCFVVFIIYKLIHFQNVRLC